MNEELNLKQAFAGFVNFVSRNNKLIILIVSVSIISVISFQKLKKPYFDTKAICMSGISEYERQEQIEDLSQRTAIDLINYLQINIDNKDYKQLADLLGVDLSVAVNIKKIEAEQLYQKDMNELFYALNKFEVVLTVFDNKIIQQVEDGLIHYFSNNEYISKYYANYKESNTNIIIDIKEEIRLLGQVRVEGARNNLDISSVNIISGKSGKEISNQIIALSQLREEINTNQDLLEPLVYVQGFAQVDKKEDDVFIWSLLVGFISFIFSLFVAQVKEVK